MGDYSEQLMQDVFSSPFVDETLFIERLGGSKFDPETIGRYRALPVAARPEISIFFDREYYLELYQDIRGAEIDPLVHFMKWGVAEGRSPHPLIDIRHILEVDPDALPTRPNIDALHDLLSRDLVDPSPHFSLEYYQSQLDGSASVAGGLLRHFLESGILLGLKPNPAFDPIGYYHWTAEKTFDLRSGLRHFVLSSGSGRPHGPALEPPTEGQGKTLFRIKAGAGQLFRDRAPLDFGFSGTPDLSVVIVLHDNFELTLQALASVRANHAGPVELILVDSGSSDETRNLAQYVKGAVLLRFDCNIGFVRGCNAALDMTSADFVLYLNNDVELGEGAIDAALRRLHSDASIGAVGGKVLRTHGLIQEAGCIIWRDGWTFGYLRDQSPLAPEANFVRDVDFCSAVFLMTRASVVKRLDGFDDAFAPAYFEDADLCFRMRSAGWRVVYDPAVLVHHLEYGSTAQPEAVHERIRAAHETFLRLHRDRLRLSHASQVRTQLFARSTARPRGRVLLIEDQLPLRRLGSGFVRSNDIVRSMAELGYHVTVYPIERKDHNLVAVYADFPDTAEIMHDRSLAGLLQFLKTRRGYYDTIWICRNHNLDLVKPILEECGADALVGVRVVLDTEAIAAPREAQRRALLGAEEPFDEWQATRQELSNAGFCQALVAVSRHEARQLEALGFSGARVLGHARPLALGARGWSERSGLLFVGALPGHDTPNYDSLGWFIDSVLPLIEQDLGAETRLTVAGFVGADVSLERLRAHCRVSMRGPMAELGPLFDEHRVFVAPTRYAAGLPYKVHEAASRGLPVVATELLRGQLGWEDGGDLLAADAADPAAFAAQVVQLYRSEPLWSRIRAGAAERVRLECDERAWRGVLADILDGAEDGAAQRLSVAC